MTIRLLRIFIAVCDCGGTTGAAQKLHLAQPAVSSAIAELERAYNVVLFDRIKQRLVLTKTGRELLIKAKEAVGVFDDFESLALSGSTDSTVRIGCSLTLGKSFLPKYIKHLRQQYPYIVPKIKIAKTDIIETLLENGELDFGFVEGRTTSGHIAALPFGGDRIVPVCAKDYLMEKEIPFSALLIQPLLLREPGSASRDMIEREAARIGLAIVPIAESASNQCLIELAREGLGVAILPESLVREDILSEKLKEITVLDASFDRMHFVIYHKNKRFTPAQRSAFEQYRMFDRSDK